MGGPKYSETKGPPPHLYPPQGIYLQIGVPNIREPKGPPSHLNLLQDTNKLGAQIFWIQRAPYPLLCRGQVAQTFDNQKPRPTSPYLHNWKLKVIYSYFREVHVHVIWISSAIHEYYWSNYKFYTQIPNIISFLETSSN